MLRKFQKRMTADVDVEQFTHLTDAFQGAMIMMSLTT